MSDLGFDVRPYCERLAKACDSRFRVTGAGDAWELHHPDKGKVDANMTYLDASDIQFATELWAFFGPLADEREIDLDRLADFHAGLDYLIDAVDPAPLGLGPVAPESERTILESIIAAVVESFESEVKA